MQVHIETSDLTDRDKLAMWMDLVCAHLIQVDCRAVTDHACFHGAVTKVSLPRLEIARIKASGQAVTRTRQQIARAKEENFLLNIQRRGSSLLRHGDREVVLEAGDCALYSSIRPYTLALTAEFEQIVLILPEALLRALNGNVDSGCAVRIAGDRPIIQLLLCTVDGLYNSAGQLPQQLGAGAIDLLVQTVTAASNPDACTTEHPALARYHLARVQDFILRRLSDPKLSLTSIATGLGMSPAHLHRLLATETETLMAWVWTIRLEFCRRELADPERRGLSIGEIAFRWGFNDRAHFSRSFRKRHGLCPRDWRLQIQSLKEH